MRSHFLSVPFAIFSNHYLLAYYAVSSNKDEGLCDQELVGARMSLGADSLVSVGVRTVPDFVVHDAVLVLFLGQDVEGVLRHLVDREEGLITGCIIR